MHKILAESAMQLFMMHLDLLGITYRRQDLPTIKFDAMDMESPLNVMQRVTMGYDGGLLTLNQSLDILNLPEIGKEGDERKEVEQPANVGSLPRENEQESAPSEEDI